MLQMAKEADANGADLIVFPELTITGYPPRDLVERPAFLHRTKEQLERLAQESASLKLAILCGYVASVDHPSNRPSANRAAFLSRGQVVFEQTKMLLPTYDVFDESRYFEPARMQHVFDWRGTPLAITVCEDAWNDKDLSETTYDRDAVGELVGKGGRVLLSINGSPYTMNKRALRRSIFERIARRHSVPVVYVNQVGGNDQLVFDGSSFVMDAKGEVIASAKSFEEDVIYADLETGSGDQRESHPQVLDAVYDALVLGTRDYMHKCGFHQALIGLSGGIDSTLVAAIAVDAIGRENVTGIGMPGPYSSDHSLTDARELAKGLGIRFEVVRITAAYDNMLGNLQPLFGDRPPDVTEENIQSRLRGMTLMSLSNKTGALVLTTGNKSELEVGYCTLYGDMVGGLSVISDVPKTMVYQLTRLANERHAGAIPENIFVKPPSAELRPDQKDTDSLPDYDTLDAILKLYVEEFLSPQQIAEKLKINLDLVREIARKVDVNEYKRQQAAPGLKVTTKAFGMGRRIPIAQRFKE
jgi:NAD+ synthase/NAD+ synthase (glutamine-hydrolysing)